MKTIVIAKLNRGAWYDTREKLIAKFKAEGSLETYSEDFVRTHDAQYMVKIMTVNPHILDPLLGFESAADASDILRFLDSLVAEVKKNYMSYSVSEEIDPAKQTGTIATPPTPPPADNDHITPGSERFDEQEEKNKRPEKPEIQANMASAGNSSTPGGPQAPNSAPGAGAGSGEGGNTQSSPTGGK